MAIAKMKKLNLVAMSYDKDAVLNALQRTNASEVKFHYEAQNTAPMAADFGELSEYLNYTEAALSSLASLVEAYDKDNKIKDGKIADGFEVSYSDFTAAKNYRAQADGLCKKINGLFDRDKELNAELLKVQKSKKGAEVYAAIEEPFSHYSDTLYTRVKIGTAPASAKDGALAAFSECDLAYADVLAESAEEAVILVVCHKSALQQTEALLQGFGFKSCVYSGDGRSGKQIYSELEAQEKSISENIKKNTEELYSLKGEIKELKIYCDYLGFELEKAELSEKMRVTQSTFLLEAYVPEEAENAVSEELNGVSGAVYYEFSEPAEDEIPPTLYKNNAVVKNFETITNMYSPANSREFDPNAVMALFYSLFLGFIMGDIGYGILMVLGGGLIYYLKRKDDGGLKRMAGVFGIGGIFAILWGVLFGSLFGITVIPPLMPNAKDDTWSVMGINIPAVLLIAMELGIVHLMAGYVCKAIQHMRRGRFWDGIFDGIVWAVFSMGAGIAIAGFIEQANMPILAYIGGGIAGGSLLVAMLTAGRHEKFFGKFTKGFGAAYGIISYVSDVLSYARLYGLMLSGAVIAEIIAEYTVLGNGTTVGFLVSGNPLLIILGVLIFVVGHVFNLAIGLLGAYIHDARLQYVEFYGRFYEGEGELFVPLGSNHKYIKLQSSAKAKRSK